MGDEFVSVEPILIAILKGNSTAARILKDAGANEKDLTAAIQALRQGQNVKSQSADENYQSLEKYAKNLVEQARSGKLDPVIGRDEKLRRAEQGQKVEIIMYDDNDPEKAARDFFANLRACDKAGADVILATALKEDGVGFSVMNRMFKSAGYNIVDV